MGSHSADSRDDGEAVVVVAAAAAAVPDSADNSSQHSKQVEVQFVVEVTVPADYSGDSKCTEAEEEVVAVAAAAAASGQAAGSIHFDLQHFHCWKYCQQMLGVLELS